MCEGTSWDRVVHHPVQRRIGWDRLPRTIFSQLFNISNDGNSTTCLSNMFQHWPSGSLSCCCECLWGSPCLIFHGQNKWQWHPFFLRSVQKMMIDCDSCGTVVSEVLCTSWACLWHDLSDLGWIIHKVLLPQTRPCPLTPSGHKAEDEGWQSCSAIDKIRNLPPSQTTAFCRGL